MRHHQQALALDSASFVVASILACLTKVHTGLEFSCWQLSYQVLLLLLLLHKYSGMSARRDFYCQQDQALTVAGTSLLCVAAVNSDITAQPMTPAGGFSGLYRHDGLGSLLTSLASSSAAATVASRFQRQGLHRQLLLILIFTGMCSCRDCQQKPALTAAVASQICRTYGHRQQRHSCFGFLANTDSFFKSLQPILLYECTLCCCGQKSTFCAFYICCLGVHPPVHPLLLLDRGATSAAWEPIFLYGCTLCRCWIPAAATARF